MTREPRDPMDEPTAPSAPTRDVRLHVDAPLGEGKATELPPEAAHYLVSVMRASAGDRFRAFNGRDGEWLVELTRAAKRQAVATPLRLLRLPAAPPDLWLLFAPIKKARTDFIVEKACELGCRRIQPVRTQRTQSERLNRERLQAHAVEAAEQCDLVFVPEVAELVSLEAALAGWPAERRMFFCDEAREAPPLAAAAAAAPSGPAALLIGPEGGFTPEEAATLRARPFVTPVSLGPRILRADTAAPAAIALWQSIKGDWSHIDPALASPPGQG